MLANPEARSKFEPPAASRAASLLESTAASPAALLTVCEQTGFQDTGRFDEIIRLGRRLQRCSSLIEPVDFGKTAEGRSLIVWSAPGVPHPRLPSILIQSAVHAGETAGKDATLMLLRDFALGRYPHWAGRCNLLVIPVFNVDGHEDRSLLNRGNQNGPREIGRRVTAQRIDLNRDYVKADAPEMRAWLRLYNNVLPHLFIDNHTSNGIDFQYDLTFHIQLRKMLWKSVAGWNRAFRRDLLARLAAGGHIAGPYFEIEEPPEPHSTLRLEFRPPGYSWGYASAQNRSAVVVETHSLKDYRTQVWAHYDFMRHSIDLVCSRPAALLRAVRTADREVAVLAASQARKRLFLDGELAGAGRPYLFRGLAFDPVRSGIAGVTVPRYRPEPRDIPVLVMTRVDTNVAPIIPAAYIIPPAWRAVLDLLRLHGLTIEPLKHPIEGEFETYRLEQECWDDRPAGGRHRLRFRCRKVRFQAVSMPGAFYLSLRQRAARVALHLLEPEGPESLLRWGFFNTIFDQTEYLSPHVFAPLAARMLRANAGASLDFLYRMSPYAEKDQNLYPVWRVPKP